jgi:enoyl-CoA hydratase/carnithine racemase
MHHDFRTLIIERSGDSERVTLNRPERLNAMDQVMIGELLEYFTRLATEPTPRVVTLTGAGRAFCAGLDLKAFADDPALGSVETGMAIQRRLSSIIVAMRRCPQPIVCLLNGTASGGGFALALASDIRIATPATRFNAAFIKVGLSGCDVGVSYLLPRLVGSSVAAEMMLTGRFMDASRAERLGLVSEVVEREALGGAGIRLVEELLSAAPMALALTKQALDTNLSAPSLESAVALEDRQQVLCIATGELARRQAAFLSR